MVKSMTGYGRCEMAEGGRKVTVEIKAVNHRYGDFSVKLPKRLGACDASVRTILKQYISRGKIDVYVSYEDETERQGCVCYNPELAREYYEVLLRMAEEFPVENDIRISTLSRYPEVLTVVEEPQDEEALVQLLERALRGAAEKFVEARIAEGERLRQDLTEKCERISAMIVRIEERSPQIVEEYRRKLSEKVAEMLGDTRLDERILATEIAVFADKVCTDEETVRLRSHVANVLETFRQGENAGRKLDFIAQEMNREANTILSKSNDIAVSNLAIDLKTEIEKIREQIQNIE